MTALTTWPRSISRDSESKSLPCSGIGEVLGPQELGHALVGGVVDQDRAQQRLLRLEIVRRLAQAGDLRRRAGA